MAVLFGNLLTVANVGDSKAFIDTGSEVTELTTSHRIEDNVGAPCSIFRTSHPATSHLIFDRTEAGSHRG